MGWTHVLAPFCICFSPSSLELFHHIIKAWVFDLIYIQRLGCIPSRCDWPERAQGQAYGCYMAHGLLYMYMLCSNGLVHVQGGGGIK